MIISFELSTSAFACNYYEKKYSLKWHSSSWPCDCAAESSAAKWYHVIIVQGVSFN